jgi:hypothetical protein
MKVTSLLAAAAILMGGCASYDGKGLVPGASTATDVEALMGAPAERLKAADGDTIWFYPRQPFGRQMHAVRIAPDGRMRSIEQTLTEQSLRKVVAGTTTRAQARELFGPPWRVSFNARMQREMWEYTCYNASQLDFFLYLQFSPDGILREAYMIEDYHKQQGDSSYR